MKPTLGIATVVAVAGGLLATTAFAVAPTTKRGRQPVTGDLNTGGEARGRGDRAAQARLQAAPLEMRTSARRLQTALLASDPVYAALQRKIGLARTDEEKRVAWNRYNTRLYGEMRRRKPSLAAYIKLLETVARSRYDAPIRRGEALDRAGFDRAEL